MKTTILGGFLFLIPLTFVAIVLGKAYQLSMIVAGPLDDIIPVHRVAGIAFVNILAILLLLIVCFLAGIIARGGWFSARIEKLDGFLIDVMPGYAVAKGMIGSVVKENDVASVLSPVMVQFDDYDQIAFEIERDDTQVVIFVPGAPSAWSGATVMVDVARVRALNIPAHQAVKLMRVLGRGSLAAKAGQTPAI